MERNKTIGLVVALLLMLSGAVVLVYAPSPNSFLPPGEYYGRGLGTVVEFVDKLWILVSPSDTNDLNVIDAEGTFVYISPADVNATAEILRKREIVWYRDAILEINANIDGRSLSIRAYGHIFPDRGIGSILPVRFHLFVERDRYFSEAWDELQDLT